MSTIKPRILLHLEYEREAQAYLKSLPLEHFMEGKDQAEQRGITVASLAVVRVYRRDLHVFNEMLVQYPKEGRILKVVPDNMGVIYEGELRVSTNYAIPLQPVGPLVVFEHVSKGSERKDYEDSFRKYEQDLKVPYYLLFYPDNQELTLYHHDGQRYATVLPNEHGRRAIPELEVEVGLLDGWVRFWFRGELVPLPGDLVLQLEESRRRREEEERLRQEAVRRAEEEARLRQEAVQKADEETRLRQEAVQKAGEEARLRLEAVRQAEQERQRADEEARLRQALEQELARLRIQLGQAAPPGGSAPEKTE
jgi:Uma2 family endonuclease